MNRSTATVQVDLARSVFDDEYAELRKARLETAPLAYKLPDALCRRVHDNLIAVEKKTETHLQYRQAIIAGGSKHFSRESARDLTTERVEKLRLGCANRGQLSCTLQARQYQR